MRFAGYELRLPGRGAVIAMALVLPILIGLGVWQLERAEAKRALQAQWASNQQSQPQALGTLIDRPVEALLHRRVTVRGRFETRQFLLVNQKHRGRPGYRVLTPLQTAGEGVWVLVMRGWMPAEAGDWPPDAPAPPQGIVSFEGTVASAPSVGLRLGAPASRPGWPREITYVDFQWAAEQLNIDGLLALVVRQESGPGGGLVRERSSQPPTSAMPPDRHVAYAVQWFAMALVLVVIFVVVNTRRTHSGRGRH